MAQCDIDALMANAKCFTCLTPGQQDILKLALLCNVIGGNIVYFSELPNTPTNVGDPIIITP